MELTPKNIVLVRTLRGMNGWVPKRSLSPCLSEYFSPHPRSPLLSPPDSAVALTSLERKGSSPHSSFCISTLMPYFSLSRQVTLCLRKSERKKVSSELFLVSLSCAQIRHLLCDRLGSLYGPSEAAGTSIAKKGGMEDVSGETRGVGQMSSALSPLGFCLFLRRRPNPRHFSFACMGGMGEIANPPFTDCKTKGAG